MKSKRRKIAEEKARQYIEQIKKLNKKYYPDTEPLLKPEDIFEDLVDNFEEMEIKKEQLIKSLKGKK